MKFLTKFLNPFWFAQDLQLNASAKAQGAMGGAMSGAAMGTQIMPGWGTAIGGVAGGLMGMFGSEEEVAPPTPEELAQQEVGLQRIKNQGLVDLRGQFNPELNRLAVAQAGRAQQGLSGIGQNIIGDINRDRSSLNQASMQQFRQQNQGFAGAERLQQMMQQQAEAQLARGGQLSPQQMRSVDQMTQSATQRQGRGSGAFNVGQLALGRHGAMQANEDRARAFAQQTQQGGLALSNPFARMQSMNAGTVGSQLDHLRNTQQFAHQNTVGDFNPLGGSLLSNTQFNQEQQSAFNTRQTKRSDDMIGGGLSVLGNVDFGNMFGGGGKGDAISVANTYGASQGGLQF